MARTVLILCCIGVLISVCAAANLVSNPSFESGRTRWSQYHQGYNVDANKRHSGVYSINCTSQSTTLTYGAYQVIKPSTPILPPFTVSAYAAIAAGSTGTGNFGFDAYTQYTNGTWTRALYRGFSSSTTAWQYGSLTPSLSGPVRQVWVYLILTNLRGTVWFDDVSLNAEVATTTTTVKPVTTTTTTKAPTTTTTTTKAPTTTTTTTKAPTTTTTTPTPTTTTSAPSTTTPTPSTTSTTTTTTTTPAPTTTTTTTTTPAPTTTTPAPTTTTSTTPVPITTTTTAAPYLVVGLRYLIVCSATDDSKLLAAAKTLDSVGAQYDVAVVSVNNSILPLIAPDGSGKYIGIITTDDLLPVAIEPQLTTYQLTYGVRWVVMYSFPHAQDGVEQTGSSSGAGAYVSFASAASSYTKGYTSGAAFFTADAWMYPSSITSYAIATPALNLLVGSNSYLGAVFVLRADGTQRLVFLIDQSPYHTHSIGIGSFWLQWVSNNFYLGLRRVYLNCHADDLFLNSDRWDAVREVQDYTLSYRINATELQDFADYQTALNARLPAGSNVTISFPFNGAGVMEVGGYAKDQLFIKTKALVNNFVFQSHTYTHPELDDLTRSQATAELTNNFEVTLLLFGSFQHPSYANTSMVTPSISGLFSPNALVSLWDVGIRAVVGDNTRVELRTPNPYHGFNTTSAKNGFSGIYIMPREATEVYYDCSDPVEEVSEYNSRYRNFFGYNSTLDQIYEREVARVIQLVLAFRYDSHMFHQLNLHEFWYNGQKQSLLSMWIDAITNEYSKYYVLPVHSHNQDILTQKWQDRDARDACGFDGRVYINPSTKQIVSVSGTTSNSCNIALTGLDVSSSATVRTEVYGVDKTVWVSAKANTPFTLTLNTPIQL